MQSSKESAARTTVQMDTKSEILAKRAKVNDI